MQDDESAISRRGFIGVIGTASAVLAMSGLAGCSPKQSGSGSADDLVSGTFAGSAEGHNGPVEVSVSLVDSVISEVEIVSEKESEGVSDNAINKMPGRIVEANSIGVDGISGATFSSSAILQATSRALTAAGLDPDDYKSVPKVTKANVSMNADVVVVGGGIAALTTALTAGQAGKNVVLIEKNGVIGGNAIFSAGLIVTAGTSWQRENGIEDSPAQYVEDLIRPDSPYLTDDPEMSLKMHTGAAARVEDLRGWGLQFVDFDAKQPRIHTIAPKAFAGGNTIIKLLTSLCEKAGVNILIDTKATELTTNASGDVVGIKAEGPSEFIEFSSPTVVLATGGYTSNKELVQKYAPSVANLRSLSGAGTTGDGLLMAEVLGGYAYGTDEGMQMFLVNDRGFDMPQVFNLSTCILVNKQGDRFVDESVVYTESAKESAKQDGQVVYVIFDDTARAMYSPYEDYFDQGVVVEATSIEDLKNQIGTPDLAATVKNYNGMVDAGTDTEFGRVSNFEKIGGNNYYAIMATPHIYNSYGGLRTDDMCRVVKSDGTVIKGLYAAGEVTGSVERQEGRNYTSGLSQGLSFGTLSASTAIDDMA